MASLLNSIKDSSLGLSSSASTWEDVKDYTNVIITLKSAVDGSATLQWADTSGRRFPTDNDIVATEYLTYSNASGAAITQQFDNRARWFRVLYDNSGVNGTNYADASFQDISLNLQTLYKKAPTELKIVDQSANIVTVNVGPSGNSLYTVLTDSSGIMIRTTNPAQTTGNALFVHLADSSGRSLATTTAPGGPESLFVALRDASNIDIDSTGTYNNALYVRPGDASGNAQASSFNVSGVANPGVALFAALADPCGMQVDTTNTLNFQASTTSRPANAMYVTLSTYDGQSISAANPLPVINRINTVGATAFDISSGIQEFFLCPASDLSSNAVNRVINLYNIFVYNDSPVTVWLKVYDASVGGMARANQWNFLNGSLGTETFFSASLGTASISPLYNITVPAGRYRDLVLPGGATFNNGFYVRATTQYRPSSIVGPGQNMVFLNGSYATASTLNN